MTPPPPTEVLAVDDEQERRPEPVYFDEIEGYDDEPAEGYRPPIPWNWDEDDDW